MADCTAVFIRHNLDTSSLNNFRQDLESRLKVKINIDFTFCDMEEFQYLGEPEEECTLYVYTHPDDFIMHLDFNSDSKSI